MIMIFPGFSTQIYYETMATDALEELEIPCPLTQYEPREMVFYNIDAIGSYTDEDDNDKKYGCIHTNNTVYVTTMSMEQLNKKLGNWGLLHKP